MPATPGAGQVQQRGNFMKISLFILGILCGLEVSSPAQSNSPFAAATSNSQTITVTNWILPSNERYCMVAGLLYDKYASPKFTTLMIPAAASIMVNYNGPVDYSTHPLKLFATWTESKTAVTVEINNFPFVRGLWNYQNGHFSYPGGSVNAQAMLVTEHPQYNNYGALVTDYRSYDCGLPLTEPYKIVRTYAPGELAAQMARQKLEAQKAATQANEGQIKAVNWLQPQATNGSPSAQCSLGIHYLNGQGCEINREFAIYWLKKAAAQGDVEASNTLAKLKL